ncbi:hypothetical protein FHG87_009259 [Trinorchestia longiramus]|nr:hypothetical protein FHG87_009259 [Trinorchestia longiramus]
MTSSPLPQGNSFVHHRLYQATKVLRPSQPAEFLSYAPSSPTLPRRGRLRTDGRTGTSSVPGIPAHPHHPSGGCVRDRASRRKTGGASPPASPSLYVRRTPPRRLRCNAGVYWPPHHTEKDDGNLGQN